jgi:hypothetical protein
MVVVLVCVAPWIRLWDVKYCMMTIPCQCTDIGNKIQFDQKIILCNNETKDITTLYT